MLMRYWPVGWMKPRALMKQINKLGMWTGESGREGLTKFYPISSIDSEKNIMIYSTSRCQTYIWKRKFCFQYVVIEAQTAGKLHSSGLSAGGQREGGGKKEGFIDPEKLLNCCSGWAGACLWPPLQLTIYTIFNYTDLMPSVTQDQNVKNMIKFRPEQNFCDWRLWGREQI